MMSSQSATVQIDGAAVLSLTNFCKQLVESFEGNGSGYGDSIEFIRDFLVKKSKERQVTVVILNSGQLESYFGYDQTLYEANRKYGTARGEEFEKQRDTLADAVNGVAPTIYKQLIATMTEVDGVQVELA